MSYDVITSDDFDSWFGTLTDRERERLAVKIERLELKGPTLDFPESSSIRGSAHGSKMRELRIQVDGDPIRILYAFDVLQQAVLLLGGNKVGDEKQWYKQYVPAADRLFTAHQLKAQALKEAELKAAKKASSEAIKTQKKKGGR